MYLKLAAVLLALLIQLPACFPDRAPLDRGASRSAMLDLDARLPRERIPSLRLKVPFLPQVPPGDWARTRNCLPACFAMLRAYDLNQRPNPQMIRDFDDWAVRSQGLASNSYNGAGYRMSAIKRYADHLGLRGGRTRQGNLPLLIQRLRDGKPVIVSVKKHMDQREKERHAMLVTGIDPDHIYVNDPGRSQGKGNRHPLADFLAVWRGGGNLMFSF
jgi:hypothetical protein